jgi:molybdopterin synthase catalytic subunit
VSVVIDSRIQTAPFDAGAELAALTGADPDCGAVASFVGQVRAGNGLETLELEHYPGRTERALVRIAEAAAVRWPLSRVRIVHRVGPMQVGEPIVFVGASAPHRRAALAATAYLIDVLKTQAPFWKKEIGPGFARWVEPTAEDAAAAEQWLKDEASEDA